MARTDAARCAVRRGVSAFIVEAGSPGITVGKPDRKMGQRGAHTADVDLRELSRTGRSPDRRARRAGLQDRDESARQGTPDDRCRVCRLGRIAHARRHDRVHQLERKQFGEPLVAVPVGPGDAGRQSGRAVCGTFDDRRRGATARRWSRTSRCTPRAASCSPRRWCGRVADRCVQAHGGAGYISDYAIERFYRDVRLFRIFEGHHADPAD